MQELDDIRSKAEHYQKELDDRIAASTGNIVLIIGAAVLLFAVGMAAFVIWGYYHHYDHYSDTGISVILFLLLLSLLCLATYKAIKAQQDKLFNEKILLRDICISIALCMGLPNNRIKEQTITSNYDRVKISEGNGGDTESNDATKEDKAIMTASKAVIQEKIIATLLSRYSG